MSDGVNIDFSALKTPDYVGDYANAFQAGRQLAGQNIQGNALTGYGADPSRETQAAIAAMTPAQRAQGAKSAEILAAMGQGLRAVPYPARRPVLDHLTPALAARGIDPAAVAAFDPTDANLDAHVAQARVLTAMLGGQVMPSPRREGGGSVSAPPASPAPPGE
ncbi:MAG TPA: hypothetical protein VFC47_13830 [Caulobacteraceae bacterium]|nr:hypothetical protein [Caulobacteraceae bacterium]